MNAVSELEEAFTSLSAAEFRERYGVARPLPGEAGAHVQLIVLCRTGRRASRAIAFLRWLGYTKYALPIQTSIRA